jgi:signal transduction histidine kinase
MQQVIVNLVLNALHAMNGSGSIRISVRRLREGGLELAFEDSGPGVKSEIAEAIFQPFFSTRSQGTGLGLAISRKIVESHDGTLHLDTGHSKGARFVITLPVPPSLRPYPPVR